MAQNFDPNIPDVTHLAHTDLAALKAALTSLRTCESGTSQPNDMIAGMWWFDINTNILKLRNEANSDWLNVYDFGNNKPLGVIDNAVDSDTVDGIHASVTPVANQLCPLDGSGNPQVDSVNCHTVDGFHAVNNGGNNTIPVCSGATQTNLNAAMLVGAVKSSHSFKLSYGINLMGLPENVKMQSRDGPDIGLGYTYVDYAQYNQYQGQ